MDLKVVNRDRKATLITKVAKADSPNFEKRVKPYGKIKRASQRDASQVQASSKDRSK
jgi:hypothetical protein